MYAYLGHNSCSNNNIHGIAQYSISFEIIAGPVTLLSHSLRNTKLNLIFMSFKLLFLYGEIKDK